MAKDRSETAEPVVIKKYANRRLYDTARGSFVTLDDIHQMVKDGRAFTVRDEKSGRDITSSVLAQIIAEQETKGHSVLPDEYLRQVLKAYGDGVGPQLASFLEQSMAVFASHQKNVTRQMRDMFDGTSAMEQLADVSRRNLEEFQRSFGLYTGQRARGDDAPPAAGGGGGNSKDDEINELRRRLARLEEKLEALTATTRSTEPDEP